MYDVFDNRQQHVDPARESSPEDRREYTVVQNPTRSGTGDWQQDQAQDLRQHHCRFGSCLILPCGQKKGRRQPRKSRLWFICGRRLWQGLILSVAVIGCFHMSGRFVRLSSAAGPDGNPPVRSLINLARFGGALNQTGLLHHWLNRYASSTAIANSFLAWCRQAGRP